MIKRSIFICVSSFIFMEAIKYSLSHVFDILNFKKYVKEIFTIYFFNVFDITVFNINYQINILELIALIFLILYFLIYKNIKKVIIQYYIQKNNYLSKLDLKEQFNLINRYKTTVQVSCYDYNLAIKLIELYSHQQHKYTTFILLDEYIDSKIDKILNAIIKRLHLPIKTKLELLTNQILYKIIDSSIYVSDTEKFKKTIEIVNLSDQGIIFLLKDKSKLNNSDIDKILNILMNNRANIRPSIFLLTKNSIYNQEKDNIIYLQGLTFEQSTHHFFNTLRGNLKNNITIEDKRNKIIIKNRFLIYNNNSYSFKDIESKLNQYDNYTSQKFIRNSNFITDEYQIVISYLYKIYVMHFGYPQIYMQFFKKIINDKKINPSKSLHIKSKKLPKVPAGVFFYSSPNKFSLPNYINNLLHRTLIKLNFFNIIDDKIELNKEYLTFNNYTIDLTTQGISKINSLYNYFLGHIIIDHSLTEVYDIKDEYFNKLKIKDKNITYKKLQNNTYLFNSFYFIIKKSSNERYQSRDMITIESNHDTYSYKHLYVFQPLNNEISISTLSLKTILLSENFKHNDLIDLMCALGIIFKIRENQYYLNMENTSNISKTFISNINKVLKNDIQHIKYISYRINKNHLDKLLSLNLIYPIGSNLYMPIDILQPTNHDRLRYLLYLRKNENMEKIYHYIEKYIHNKNIKFKVGCNQLKLLSEVLNNRFFFERKTIEKLFNNRLYQYASNIPYAYFMHHLKYGAYCKNKEIEAYKLYYIIEFFNEKQLFDMYNNKFMSKYCINQYLSYVLTIERLLYNRKKYNNLIQLYKKEIISEINPIGTELTLGFNFIEDKDIIDKLLRSSSTHRIYLKSILRIKDIIDKGKRKDIKYLIDRLENLPTQYLDNFNFREDYIKYAMEDFNDNRVVISSQE